MVITSKIWVTGFILEKSHDEPKIVTFIPSNQFQCLFSMKKISTDIQFSDITDQSIYIVNTYMPNHEDIFPLKTNWSLHLKVLPLKTPKCVYSKTDPPSSIWIFSHTTKHTTEILHMVFDGKTKSSLSSDAVQCGRSYTGVASEIDRELTKMIE